MHSKFPCLIFFSCPLDFQLAPLPEAFHFLPPSSLTLLPGSLAIMSETRNILVLGASYAGLGSAHSILRHVYPALPRDQKVEYKAILVDPSTKWYQRHGSPRAAASADLIPADKIFLDIEPGFKRYGDAFRFVQGKATAWDPEARAVVIQKADGSGDERVEYYALVLATGSKTYAPVFSQQGNGYVEVEEALQDMHGRLKNAESIVIAGGGPTAVETAGEVGYMLNGSAGCFSSRPAHQRVDITVITNADKLLPVLKPAVAKQAEKYLNRVGVDVRYRTKVSSTRRLPDGKTQVVLHDGTEIAADLYIPAMGVQPLSDYVPAQLKDEMGYVRQNNETLRIDSVGPRVYAIGDVGTASRNTILDIYDQVPVLCANVKRDLGAAQPSSQDRVYKPKTSALQIVPIGRSKGVGELFGWTVPSWFVWMIKGRDYMLPQHDTVNGDKWAKEA